ncbi:hypothetical protein V2J09_015066 [Rumex salicifolius]
MPMGHLGELPLASTAIAVSLCNVTGHNLLSISISQLNCLRQSWGSASLYACSGGRGESLIISIDFGVLMPPLCIPLKMPKVLNLIGQDPTISHEAQRYAIYLIPSLFAYATLQPLIQFFQAQSMITPMALSSIACLCFHLPLCWMLIFKSELGSVGSAVSTGVSMWLNVVFLALYMKFSSACAKARSPLSLEILKGMGEFFRFAVPSAGMVCLEWLSFDLLVLLSGFLPNPALETSVISVWYVLTTISTLYAMPYGIGAAASTRVSNELGGGSPDRARVAVYSTMLIASMQAIVTSSALFAARGVFGYLFSNEEAVITYVTKMTPLVCISAILDGVQGALCGIARGSGWQHMAVIVVLGAFYLVGIPTAIWMAFWLKMGGKGLWIGILVGALIQTLVLAVATGFTDWEKQATMARERLFPEESQNEDQEEICNERSDVVGRERGETLIYWAAVGVEIKKVGGIAAPLVAVVLSQFLLQVVSIMMVGHLGQLSLSSSALAISFATVSGFSLLMGMASGLETISGQAYGAQQFRKVGIQTYTAIFSLNIVCIPLSILWINMETILNLLGQDPSISHESGRFLARLIPALFAYASLQPMVRYFQSQSLITPMLVASVSALLIHIPLCWLLVFKTGLASLGAAVAMATCMWLNVVFLGIYLRFSPLCDKTRATPFTMEVFHGVVEFFRFGNAAGARIAVSGVMTIAVLEGITVGSVLFALRSVYGYSFSSDKEVVAYVTQMTPLLCTSVMVDSLQGVISGIARGCGWQHIGAVVNLGAYYLFGIPMAVVLGFCLELKGKGLWLGIMAGASLQTLLLFFVTFRVDWENEV